MIVRVFVLIVAFSFLGSLAYPQSTDIREITVLGDPVTVFDRTLDYLHGSSYFIESVDKDAGFLQAKIFLKSRSILSSLSGTRLSFNFLIRQVESSEHSKISLQVYEEERRFGGNVQNKIYYYDPKGIATDERVYQNALEGLQDYLDTFD